MDTDVYPLAKTLFTKGLEQLRRGDRLAAIASFDRVLQLDPDCADVYGHRCVARHQTGDLKGAICDCQRAAILYLEQGNTQYKYAFKMLKKLQAMNTPVE